MDSVCGKCKKLHRSCESGSADLCRHCKPADLKVADSERDSLPNPEKLQVEWNDQRDKLIESQKRLVLILSEENDELKRDIDRLTEMLAKEVKQTATLHSENAKLIELMEQRKSLDSLDASLQNLHHRMDNIAETPLLGTTEQQANQNMVEKVMELEKRCEAVADLEEKPLLLRQINELRAACEPPADQKAAIEALVDRIEQKHKQGLLAEKLIEELKSLIDSVTGGQFYQSDYERLANKNVQIKKRRSKESTAKSK